MEEEGRIGAALRTVLRPQAHVLPLPDAEGHGVALAVPLAPLMDEEHSVPPAQQGLSPAAEVPDAEAAVAVAADMDGMARLPRVPVPRQLQPVLGGDVYPLAGQVHQFLREAIHLVVFGQVLRPVGQMERIVLLTQRRIEHETIDAVADDQQQQQQDQQDDGNDHGDLRGYVDISI